MTASAGWRTTLRTTLRTPRAALLVDSKCTLGEGATWCAKTGRFYWTDIEGARLWRHDPRDGRSTFWTMPERLATFALCADPHYLLLGLASHLAFFDLATGETRRIVDVEPALNTRVNDGRCDRQGRFVFGTKDEGSPVRPVGGFYRLNHDLSLERLPLPAPAISNSIAFSPDGATMYYCDSPTREIRACDYLADGGIANDRLFTRLTDASGEPDGSTVDRDGGVWNAQWGGARVVRYGADGVETERVDVPTVQPSCVALGGPQL
ncbi:MAG TPA: SMP-30/gluconolactonase/LRE family protein, partial [Paraburkholderia sp.]|uniref:SMP-30/gluconolactonase/LRE family protein n=1 Tax=Paraburkholderia sp. TaxID=1926495 RepID=UPI002ED173E4